MSRSAILLISCPDRTGLVATITEFLYRNNGDILHLDQHVDAEANVFFMRIEFDLDGFSLSEEAISAQFQPIADQLNMHWELHLSDDTPRMAVFVSKQGHCLYDILARYQSGEWQVQIPLIVSNHPDMQSIVEKFGIDFHLLNVTKDNKPEQEQV